MLEGLALSSTPVECGLEQCLVYPCAFRPGRTHDVVAMMVVNNIMMKEIIKVIVGAPH